MPARKKARASQRDASDSEESWPDEDLDEAGFGEETRHLLGDDSDGPDEVETLTKSGKLRLRPDIALGGEYSGRKVSRKEAFGELSDEEVDNHVDEGEDEDEIVEHDEDKLEAGVDDDFEAVDREYEELQQEEQEMLLSLRDKSDGDAQKGQAVKRQKEMWDKALDTRIALQKLVTSSNRLQRSSDAPSEVLEAYQELSSSVLQTLHSLLDLEDAWLEQNPAVLEGSEEKGSKPSSEGLEAAWERLSCSYSRLIPFRNRSLDRWHRKTQISTGAAASRAKLKAFNQSISQQVANAMKDPSRLVARMITGQATNKKDDETSRDTKAMELDGFDDSEFYQQLLREFLESSDPMALGTLDHDAVRKLRNKKRKVVDRRASKGRKLRYTVHERLVNFMVPEPVSLPPMAPQLFASLFGSKSTPSLLQEAAA